MPCLCAELVMIGLFYSELTSRARLTASDAVALALAAAAACEPDGGPRRPVPAADNLVLRADGTVTLASPDAAPRDPDPVRALALLLRDLLALDGADVTTRPKVPGALLVLLARASGQIDLPPPSFPSFRDALSRFAAAGQPLCDLYAQCRAHADTPRVAPGPVAWVRPRRVGVGDTVWAGRRTDVRRSLSADGAPEKLQSRGTVVRRNPDVWERRTGPAAPAAATHERRRTGPSVTDLRRELRARDRELFAAIGELQRRGGRVTWSSALAIWIAAALLGFLLVLSGSGVELEALAEACPVCAAAISLPGAA